MGYRLENCNEDGPEMTPVGPAAFSPALALKLGLVGGTGQHATRMFKRPHGEPCGLESGNQVLGCQATPTDPGSTTESEVS